MTHSDEAAVQHSPHVPLQILAGPGSGKTKVLTSRIAYLIIQHRIAPSSICAVTFTNKAANEMRVRLTKLIGKEATSRLRMGTFHSLCARFLRMHANLAGLESNFTICDAQESQKIIAKLLKPFKNFLEDRNISLREGSVAWRISQAKSKGQGPDDVVAEAVKEKGMNGTIQKTPENLKDTDPTTYVIVEVFREYRITLLRSNSLDFDDLLLYGVKLFGTHKKVSMWCKHILVDEFQDTNTMQYELMTHIAAEHHCVTIVGDPDQSIYAWRSADVTNLKNMIRDFPATEQIFLEQNYRSTASILSLSLAIISEDKERIKKSLHTAHPKGPVPTQLCLVDEMKEAEFIATEIKRLVAVSGGMLTWSDFAILMRFTALSREIETALQRESIPHKVLGGHKFFERMEVKDILAYLQLVDNGSFLPAFNRCINNPPRSIGEKSVSQILQRAEKDKISALDLVERIHDGKVPDIKPPLKRKVATFISTIRTVRNLAKKRVSAAALIRTLLDLLNYEEHLKKTQDDWQNRWENVQELINFASKEHETIELPVPPEPKAGKENDPVASQLEADGFAVIDNNQKKKEAAEPSTDQAAETPLRLFLQASMLSTDTETKDKEDGEEKNKDKVVLSTCHSAKGLEWPVVIVPATENGVFPHIRSEDEAEERRLLYVACTRAQSLLYLLTTVERMVGGARKARDLSFFVTRAIKAKRDLITAMLPEATLENRKIMAGVLSRPLPPEAEIEKRLEEL
ncbi:UvrD-helicase-domain-containing protein [Dentipellis sp. KUC8613]|nr:UvrD-helicase-domain-containing protein [Dentipellis sp. KUC8613]